MKAPTHTGYGKFVVAAFVTLLLSGCQASLFGFVNATSGDSGLAVDTGVTFDPAHDLALDVYAPADAHDLPVVVFFYGGSWQDGKRQWYRWMGETLARHGLVVAVPDYRKYPDVHMDGFMSDATRAVGWVHDHAGDYGGDPDTLFLMGHSAGAHIGALLATDGHWLGRIGMQPRQLAGFIGAAGPYDFLPLKDPAFKDMFGPTQHAREQSQPVHFVDGDEPPMLLLQGTDDDYVSVENTRSMAQHLRDEDEPVAVHIYPDLGHVRLLLSYSQTWRDSSPALPDTLRFIHAHDGRDKP